ncbi:unnamed protein product [Dovyalis caffra]|uniref:Uncharacterized protein n=1 Tax=Dovyalis caffra TaxID=77055 RepID=A0AAV1RFC2_9ROSI|nr:unnamed protein product [Dovyalis caffra]
MPKICHVEIQIVDFLMNVPKKKKKKRWWTVNTPRHRWTVLATDRLPPKTLSLTSSDQSPIVKQPPISDPIVSTSLAMPKPFRIWLPPMSTTGYFGSHSHLLLAIQLFNNPSPIASYRD